MFTFKGDYIIPVINEVLDAKIAKTLKFYKYMAYFDKYYMINDNTSTEIYQSLIDELEFKLYGGKTSRQLTEGVNLVVIK